MPVYTQVSVDDSVKIVAKNAQDAIKATQTIATANGHSFDVVDHADRLVAQVAPKSRETVVSKWVKPA